MSQLVHKFLGDKDRGRNIVATISAVGAALLIIATVVTSFMYG